MSTSQAQPDWELSKENIQPLKNGRKASKLENISKPKDLKALNEERQKYETEIRMYDGDDPLDPWHRSVISFQTGKSLTSHFWFRYISWIEQEYPKGGKEGNLSTLIESCIKKFKDEKSVRNDERFLEIWLKYAAMASKPLEVFDFMYSNALCTLLAEFYTTWAWYLECSQSYKRAEEIFTKGVYAMVDGEMKGRMRTRQEQFRQRVQRRLNGEEIPDEEVEEEQRSALGQLRGHGRKARVSNIRVGAEKLGGPGVLSGGGLAGAKPLKPANNQPNAFKIFTDEAGSSSSSGRSGASGSGVISHVPSRADQKENQMAAGTWTKARIVKKSQNVPIESISQHSKPAFTVYEEPNLVQPSKTPQRKMMAAETKVLAVSKAEKKHDCPIALFEPPDPSKRVMYCKDRVYQGTTEFSFEELRALRVMEKVRQQEEMEKLDQRKVELLEMENRLREKQEAMDRQMEQMAELQRLLMEKNREAERQEQESSLPALSRGPSLDSTAMLLAANPRPGLSSPSPLLSQPSPTVNTKEAMDVMQQLWSKPIGEDSAPAPAPTIYCDPEPEKTEAPSQPFTIFCDENPQEVAPRRRDRAEMININGNDKENFLIPSAEENRENQPPLGYLQPKLEPRTKTGILTEADNVEFVPLEEQERLLDQEEEGFQVFVESDSPPEPSRRPGLPTPFSGNQTILLPNEKDFGEMARLSSTPFTGKPSHCFEQDENTCAVDILYKMPPPPAPVEEGLVGARLDTIVETSREYRSSSSSSGGETLHQYSNRSHWGTTGHTIHSQTGISVATPGHHLATAQASLTNASGYLGDKSNNITKSGVKDNKRELISSPQVTSYDKKMKMLQSDQKNTEEDMFDEPTGLFSDMIAEFQEGRAQLQTSLQASILDFPQRDQTRMEVTRTECLDITAPRLNITEAPPRLNLTEAAPRLDLTGAVPEIEVTEAAPRLDLTVPGINLTLGNNCTGLALGAVSPPPALELTDANMEDLASQATNLSIDDVKEDLDPFHPDTHKLWLSKLKKTVRSYHGYVDSRTSKMPSIRSRATVSLGPDVFLVQECKGEGGYAKVWSASRQDDDMDCTISGIDAVLKVQKPANDWEFYVCSQVQQRIPEHLAQAFMSIPRNYAFQDGGVFVSYHQKLGTLLDIINIVKSCQGNKFSIEPMAVFFTIELLQMIEALHGAGIIHADLKADNLLLMVGDTPQSSVLTFLFQHIPTLDSEASSPEEMFQGNSPTLQLIDFGRSIDLTLLQDNVTFNKVWTQFWW